MCIRDRYIGLLRANRGILTASALLEHLNREYLTIAYNAAQWEEINRIAEEEGDGLLDSEWVDLIALMQHQYKGRPNERAEKGLERRIERWLEVNMDLLNADDVCRIYKGIRLWADPEGLTRAKSVVLANKLTMKQIENVLESAEFFDEAVARHVENSVRTLDKKLKALEMDFLLGVSLKTLENPTKFRPEFLDYVMKHISEGNNFFNQRLLERLTILYKKAKSARKS
eukprot:TRINITY_DN10898_c0_g1_i3.p1 TRINITY_DN10898_c0_g1~~TRINITY_DN10898_c0_g1_i3.p1  ORF type:complete len:228 (-),score=35.73 TRINITY_DN10898_c0_g1_i3:125-808(-)